MSMTVEQDAQPGADYARYSELLAPLNDPQPQRQGLNEEEYLHALANPQVIKTTLEANGESVQVPQLEPVEAFEWLYTPYFEKHFPDEQADGRLLHFSDIPGVEPGQAVRQRIQQLAQEDGVLVFDYPISDPEYPGRVSALLAELGVAPEETKELDAQTYFAGQIHLKRERPASETPLHFREAFDHLVARGGFDEAQRINGTSLETVVEGEEADRMCKFYADAYETISDCPCTQALSPDEFREMLADPEVGKVVYRTDGMAETVCLLTEDIEGLDWVNADFYERKFPDKYKSKEVVWFPGIATDPDPAIAGHNAADIVSLIALLYDEGDHEPLVVFDAPGINTGFLDVYLDEVINATPHTAIKFETIGAQKYCAIKLHAAQ